MTTSVAKKGAGLSFPVTPGSIRTIAWGRAARDGTDKFFPQRMHQRLAGQFYRPTRLTPARGCQPALVPPWPQLAGRPRWLWDVRRMIPVDNPMTETCEVVGDRHLGAPSI